MSNVHASCVAFGRKAVLIRGAPGSGKSTLALQLIDGAGFGLGARSMRARLVADDQVLIKVHGRKLMASAPPAIAGLIEIRGVGLLRAPQARAVPLHLVVDLVPETKVERLPQLDDLHLSLLGIDLARIALAERHPSAAAIVRSALQALA